MEMDLQTEQDQTAEELRAVEAEPDSREDSPKEEHTYSQTEVEVIIREHLRRFQSMQTSVEQQETDLTEREMNLEKKAYLTKKIHEYSKKVPPFRHEVVEHSCDFFYNMANGLFGFLESKKLDSFAKAVDTVFDLLAFVQRVSYEEGESARSYAQVVQLEERKRDEDRDILQEIFDMGGRF